MTRISTLYIAELIKVNSRQYIIVLVNDTINGSLITDYRIVEDIIAIQGYGRIGRVHHKDGGGICPSAIIVAARIFVHMGQTVMVNGRFGIYVDHCGHQLDDDILDPHITELSRVLHCDESGILADALEDAGCVHRVLLDELRTALPCYPLK